MYHSITFIDIHDDTNRRNTWDDWHLIPASRPVISPPGIQTRTVEIPGLNGSLDLTEIVTGYPVYKNRSGSIDFYVENDYWNWEVAYATILKYLHGKRLRCILEDDPSYFYEGRFAVSEWRSEKTHSRITIQYDVYPYKKEITESDEPWLWDPFNFETDIISYISAFEAGETVTVIGNEEPVTPVFIFSNVDGSVTITHEYGESSVTHTVTANGRKTFPDIVIKSGENRIVTSGSGTIQIKYRGGML